MSTNASISYVDDECNVHSIYLHWDGDRAGDILKEHYTEEWKVDELMCLGNLSMLAPSTDCPAGHTFNTPVRGYCVAYERDRGERRQHATVHKTVREMLNACQQQYNWIYVDGEWKSI